MNPDEKLTMKQALEEVETLRRIFPSVRLLSGEQLKEGSTSPAGDISIDGIKADCGSRIAVSALNEKKQITKLELSGSDVLQIIAQ